MKSSSLFDKALAILLGIYVVAIFSSMAVLEISIWTLMVMLLTGMLRTRHQSEGPKPFRLGIDWVLLGLVIVVVLGWFFNREDGADFGRIIGSVRWVVTLYGMTFILAYLKVPSFFLRCYIGSVFIASVYGFVTVYTGWDFVRSRAIPFRLRGEDDSIFFRAVSFLGSPMQLGHTLSIAVCVLIGILGYRILQSRKVNWKANGFLIATVVVTSICLAMTYTRGAWIAAFAGIAVVLFLLSRRWFLYGAVVFGVFLAALMFSSDRFKMRVTSIFTTKANYSNMARVDLWKMNIEMFKDHPLIGVGLNRNEDIVERYYQSHGIENGFGGHAHSNYLQFLSGTGGLGFLFYMSFIVFYLVLSFRLWKLIPHEQVWHRGLLLGAIGGQTALHVGGLTECNFKTMLVNHHFIFILAIVSALNFIYGSAHKVQISGLKK